MAGDSSTSSSGSSSIPKLRKSRSAYKSQLTRLEVLVADHEMHISPLSEAVCIELINKIKSLENIIREINSKIFEETPEDDIELAVDEAQEVENRVLNLLARLRKIKATLTPSATPIPNSQQDAGPSTTGRNNVRLPQMDLPTFDGAFENWLSFKDLFTTSVEDNTSLSGAQKLQYLKSCLKGEAALLIKSYTVTDSHYAQAWDSLNQRYNHKSEITQALLKRLFSLHPLRQETASGLRHLMDVTSDCSRFLSVLGYEMSKCDFFLVFLITERLDPTTRKQWALTATGSDYPSFDELQLFLEAYIRGLRTDHPVKASNHREKKTTVTHHVTNDRCALCKGTHRIYQCTKFKNLTPEERITKVKALNLCTICLSGHSAKECKKNWLCRRCGKSHNTLLHKENNIHDVNSSDKLNPNENVVLHMNSNHETKSEQVLFMTAQVNAQNPSTSTSVPVRAFLDSGSEVSIVDEETAKSLNLPRQKTDVQVLGLGLSNLGKVRYKVTLKIKSQVNDSSFVMEALVLPKVTMSLPRRTFVPNIWHHLNGLTLADPKFIECTRINVLLGADVFNSILRPGIRQGPKLTPTAQNTTLGWVLTGKIKTSDVEDGTRLVNHIIQVDEILQRFWEIESIPNKVHLSQEEAECERHFAANIQRGDNGRSVVRLPFKDNIGQLGLSKQMAEQRLLSLKRRFRKFPIHKDSYINFMKEYNELKHMHLLGNLNDVNWNEGYCLPHHFVLKDNSSTTKLRVVFDGSAKTSSGLSLNDCMMVGPTIQSDLFDLLLKFRIGLVALKADIAKMFRQFDVHPEDTKFQRILWRENPSEPIQVYELTTVTYGTSSAPFLSTRCLKELAKENRASFPLAAKAIDEAFFVDDLITSVDYSNEAIQLYDQLSSMLALAKLDIRKWSSNCSDVLKYIPRNLHDGSILHNLNEDAKLFALGIQWNPEQDFFCFLISDNRYNATIVTKRILLADLASIFDPLGLLSLVTVKAKLIFQELWKLRIDWDEELPSDLQANWNSYREELKDLSRIKIPRCIKSNPTGPLVIHGFADASERAYGCCVYVVQTMGASAISSNLLVAKTKIAPLVQVHVDTKT